MADLSDEERELVDLLVAGSLDPGRVRAGSGGPPATAQREGSNVHIEGYFFAESTSEGTDGPIPNALIAGGPVEHALTE